MAGLGAGAGGFTADQQHQKVELERARLRQQARQFRASRKDQQEARRQSQENFDANRQDQLDARQQAQDNWELGRQDQLENRQFNQDVTTRKMGWEEALHSERMDEARARREMYEQNFNAAKERFAEEQRMMDNRKFLAQSATTVSYQMTMENGGVLPVSSFPDLSKAWGVDVIGGVLDRETGDFVVSFMKDGQEMQEVIPKQMLDTFMQSIYGAGVSFGGGRRVAAGGQAEQSSGSLSNDLVQLKRLTELRDAEMDPERRREYDGWARELRSRVGDRFGSPSSDGGSNTKGGTFLDGLRRPKGITGNADQAAPRPPKADPQPEGAAAPAEEKPIEERPIEEKPAAQEEPAKKRASRLWSTIEGYKKQREAFPDQYAGATQKIEAAQKELVALLDEHDNLVLPTDRAREEHLVRAIISAKKKLDMDKLLAPGGEKLKESILHLERSLDDEAGGDKNKEKRLRKKLRSDKLELKRLENEAERRVYDQQQVIDAYKADLKKLRRQSLGF